MSIITSILSLFLLLSPSPIHTHSHAHTITHIIYTHAHSTAHQVKAYFINCESDAEFLDSHLLLLAPVLLHECDEAGALPVSVVILEEINDVLRVFRERGIVTAATGRVLRSLPTAGYDHRAPVLRCREMQMDR